MGNLKLGTLLWLSTSLVTNASFLNDGRCAGKILRAKEDARSAAYLIKSIGVATPDGKIKLTSMVNDMVYVIESGIYDLNQMVPSITSKPIHEELSAIVDSTNKISHQVLDYLHKDSDKLKECLPNSLDKMADLAGNASEVLQKIEEKNQKFIINQVRKAINQGSFAILKAKLEIEFFRLATRELETEVNARSEAFYTSLQNIKSNVHDNYEDLVYFVQHLEQVRARIVAKLEDFVHTNSGHEKNSVTVNEVLKGLETFCESFHQLVSGHPEMGHLKGEFEKLYKSLTDLMKKLFSVDVSGNIHGEMLIRSVIFDSVTLSSLYGREINSQITRV